MHVYVLEYKLMVRVKPFMLKQKCFELFNYADKTISIWKQYLKLFNVCE